MKLKTCSFSLATALIGFSMPCLAAQPQAVRIEGSSAGLTISQAAGAEFRRGHSEVAVSVALSGSGGALGKFCRGEVDVVHSARPILKAEIEACQKAEVQFIELPLAFDALTVVVNPKNGFVQSLTVAELRAMWEEAAQGRVTRWNQINASFPDAPLKLLAPDAQFEGSNYFAAAVLGAGKASRRDYMGSVDDNVLIQGVARDVNTLSYLPLATYLENRQKLRAVPIARSPGEKAVAPTAQTIASGEYQPLSRPIFLYVSAKSLARPQVAAFAAFYAANAARLAKNANYVALTESTYRQGGERQCRRVAGSARNGAVALGLTMQELQKRERKL